MGEEIELHLKLMEEELEQRKFLWDEFQDGRFFICT